jgi:hypothetical protein
MENKVGQPKKDKLCKTCGETHQANFYKTVYGRCKKCHSNHINKVPDCHFDFKKTQDLTFDLSRSQELREMYY